MPTPKSVMMLGSRSLKPQEATELKWRKGKPDLPGWWWLWPDEEFQRRISDSTAWPRIVEVKNQAAIGEPELYIQNIGYRQGQLKAWLFKGRVAGPIPEPIGA